MCILNRVLPGAGSTSICVTATGPPCPPPRDAGAGVQIFGLVVGAYGSGSMQIGAAAIVSYS